MRLMLTGLKQGMMVLQAVERFVVGHAYYGEVQFLVPVDLRGLDLDKTVALAKGRIHARML